MKDQHVPLGACLLLVASLLAIFAAAYLGMPGAQVAAVSIPIAIVTWLTKSTRSSEEVAKVYAESIRPRAEPLQTTAEVEIIMPRPAAVPPESKL